MWNESESLGWVVETGGRFSKKKKNKAILVEHSVFSDLTSGAIKSL